MSCVNVAWLLYCPTQSGNHPMWFLIWIHIKENTRGQKKMPDVVCIIVSHGNQQYLFCIGTCWLWQWCINYIWSMFCFARIVPGSMQNRQCPMMVNITIMNYTMYIYVAFLWLLIPWIPTWFVSSSYTSVGQKKRTWKFWRHPMHDMALWGLVFKFCLGWPQGQQTPWTLPHMTACMTLFSYAGSCY